MQMAWMIGVDVGGTFTDFFAFDDTDDRIVLHKVPSTPANPAQAVIAGLRELIRHGVDLGAITRLSHGTTVATNALIQRRGGKVALVVTEGFRDLIEIGRQIRPKVFDLQADYPAPLVPRELRFEAAERITADGSTVRALEPQALPALVKQIGDAKPDACAVCLLFSFLNPAHEAMIRDALAAAYPDMYLSISSEVQPEFREYERLSTTVLNAYLQPVMDRYLGEFADGVAKAAPKAALGINQSSGGLMSVARARHMPIRTALSGPAAGAVGAIHMARLSGIAGRHLARHGRHQRGRRADPRLYGRHDLQQMDRGLSGAHRLARHQCGRRRRRLDRVVRPRRADEGRPAERGRAAGPGLLRPWWPRGHCHRREPRARAALAARPARRRHGAG